MAARNQCDEKQQPSVNALRSIFLCTIDVLCMCARRRWVYRSLTHQKTMYWTEWYTSLHTLHRSSHLHTPVNESMCVFVVCVMRRCQCIRILIQWIFFLLVKENIVKLKCTRQIWNVIQINLVMYQWLYVRFDGQSIECDVCVLHTNYCELLLSFDELQLHTTEPAKKYISCVNGRRSWTLVCMRERVCSVYARVYVCVSVCKSGGVRFCPKKNHASSVVVRMSSGAPHIWMS